MAIRLTGTDTNGVSAISNNDTWITLQGQLVANVGEAFSFGPYTQNEYLIQGTVVSSAGDAIGSNFVPSLATGNLVTIASSGVVNGRVNGIFLEGVADTVVNNGEAIANFGIGIGLRDYGIIANHGFAIGDNYGLQAIGTGVRVNNFGTARGEDFAGARVGGANAQLENYGLISGFNGVTVTPGKVTVVNDGDIIGLYDGIGVFSNPSDTVTIMNTGRIQTSGISSNTYGIKGHLAQDHVTNEGEIVGNLSLGSNDDRYVALMGTLSGDIEMGLGNDLVMLGDGALAGRQNYDGGAGSDTLDLSEFSSAIWVDLQYGNTQVWTRDGETLAPAAGDWRKIVDLDGVENITGTEGVDLMRGDGSDNTFGYLGTALIAGIEQIDGRGGSDTMDFSRAGFAVWVDLNLAANHAYTQDDANATDAPTGANPWRKIANLASIENLIGTDRVDDLRGTGGDNSFGYRGGQAFAGVERIDGRGGSDAVDFSSLNYAVWVDLAAAGNEVWTQYDPDATDGGGNWAEIADLTSVENITGSQRADLIRGDAGANRIEGGGGNDLLTGRAGADTFVFAGDFGDDSITDFDADNAEKIDLSGVASIGTYIDLSVNHVSQNGAGDLVITDDNANTITLVSYDLGDMGNILGSDDFIF